MGKIIQVLLKVRRFDLKDDPDFEDVRLNIDTEIEYQALKKFLYSRFNVQENKHVFKVRNMDHCLIPLGDILFEENMYYILDILEIKGTETHTKAVNKKIEALLQRLNCLEELTGDIEWRKQANTEENINILSDKVEFLSRRFEQLLPPTVKQHVQ